MQVLLDTGVPKYNRSLIQASLNAGVPVKQVSLNAGVPRYRRSYIQAFKRMPAIESPRTSLDHEFVRGGGRGARSRDRGGLFSR